MVDALAVVELRNQFYKNGQRRAVSVLVISLITNGLLLWALIILLLYPPSPKYFPVGINGHILPIIPTDQINQTDESVLEWASQAAVASFSYSFVDYREELQASSGFFTPNGWTQFLNALQASNNLLAVKSKSMVVSAQMISPPTILKKGVLKGTYSWRIDVPTLVTYQNDTQYTQQYNMVSLLVTRVPMINSPRGIGIEQLVVTPIANGAS